MDDIIRSVDEVNHNSELPDFPRDDSLVLQSVE